MISHAAINAVTSPGNLAGFADSRTGFRAVRDSDVVAELSLLEGIDAGEARRLGREAVTHVGGHIEHKASGGLRAGRLTRGVHETRECWWVPAAAVRE
jgi:hypothetical protein